MHTSFVMLNFLCMKCLNIYGKNSNFQYFRALSMIYNELEKRTEEDLSIHISYLEIYQEIGYDLLNPGLRTQSYVTPFPKVALINKLTLLLSEW